MKKNLVKILAILLLLLYPLVAMGATTADVEILFTPAIVGITDNATSYNFGNLLAGATANTSQAYVGITNGSNVVTNVTLGATNSTWGPGVSYTHAEDGSPGADTVGLMSSNNTGAYDIVVKFSGPNNIYPNLPVGVNFSYEVKIFAPTSYTEETPAVEKSNSVRATASAA